MATNKTSSKKIIFFVVLIIFVWIAVNRFGKTEEIVRVLASGKWYWIVAAVICQLFFYPFYARFAEKVFHIFDVNLTQKNILPVYLASKFTDVALPIASVGKFAIFIRNGKKFNISPLNAGIGIGFVLFFEVLAFTVLSVFTILILLVFNNPPIYVVITLLILIAIMSLVVWFLIRRSISKKPVNRFFMLGIRVLLKFAKKGAVVEEDIQKVFSEIGKDLQSGKEKLWPTFKLAFVTHLINLFTFAFIFLAFSGHFDFMAILATYVAGILFTIISVTPQGVGVAETVMIATMRSFGVDFSVAAVITLAFRGLLYWLPLFIGFYYFSHLELKEDK